ncbi:MULTISPECIES: sugar MFS transporter [unclassified Massilia]|uniref:sugar MFS transporter n=1 Tax=unclassified Massilia TaxID=2609279 RepID=UPI00177DC7F1|nr:MULTISPECIES: sugar MFS transporter [unclassified Massilia]MBD8532996.1 sugar MFS transporter [Massilia sp. CFBP 13647]MBD8676351.1 sugar MFS transporter [Massilia sp. CFBP 13721]
MHIDSPSSATAAGVPANAASLQTFVFALFFIFGGITSLNDVIIPKLKDLFTLSYAQAMLVQSAFFAAYFIVSIPAAAIVRRIGYMRTAVVGLLTMTAGCLLFIPASSSGMFPTFLVALFVLASGITIVQVVANPLISLLGAPHTAHSRLTFAQAFNSLGTTVFPYVGAILILGSLATIDPATLSGAALDAYRADETRIVVQTYLGLAVALVVVAALVWHNRKKLVEAPAPKVSMLRAFELLRQPRFALGALCIFLYVGAEVAVGSVIVNYLMEANVLGLDAEAAGKHVPLYWGGAMVGRFIGAALLRMFSPGKVLACAATVTITLLLVSANSTGMVSGWSLLAVGLFNSIMFPTIFSLACEGLGERAAEGSGLICMAIVGGAIVPLLMGHAADTVGLKMALIVPALCYAVIVCFGIFARRPRKA